jgi:cytoskeletal protein RodZ
MDKKRKKIVWTIVATLFVAGIALVGFVFIQHNESTTNKKISSTSTSSTKVVSSESESTSAKAESSSQEENHQTDLENGSSVISSANEILSIDDARKLIDEAKLSVNSGDFSSLDIAKLINQAHEKNIDFIKYLQQQGY